MSTPQTPSSGSDQPAETEPIAATPAPESPAAEPPATPATAPVPPAPGRCLAARGLGRAAAAEEWRFAAGWAA